MSVLAAFGEVANHNLSTVAFQERVGGGRGTDSNHHRRSNDSVGRNPVSHYQTIFFIIIVGIRRNVDGQDTAGISYGSSR